MGMAYTFSDHTLTVASKEVQQRDEALFHFCFCGLAFDTDLLVDLAAISASGHISPCSIAHPPQWMDCNKLSQDIEYLSFQLPLQTYHKTVIFQVRFIVVKWRSSRCVTARISEDGIPCCCIPLHGWTKTGIYVRSTLGNETEFQ